MSNTPTVSLQAYVRSGAVQQRLNDLLGKRAGEFTTSLMAAINSNPVLQDCTPETVVKAAIVAAGMNLPIDPNLGLAYIIPYNNKKKEKVVLGSGKEVWKETFVMEAQFQLGYKGFIQLAQRSNQFKRINATDVRFGEYQGIDRRSGEITFKWEEDDEAREKLKVVGYLGYFKLLNGFEKELYMSVEDLQKHAKKYSKNYAKYGSGLWKDQFDVMAKKTVLKLLISKYGALSTSLQEAVLADQAAVGEDDQYRYVDNEKDETPNDDTDQTPPEDKTSDDTDKGSSEDTAPTPDSEPAKESSDDVKESDEPVEGEVVEPQKTGKELLQEKIAASKARREADKKAEEGK